MVRYIEVKPVCVLHNFSLGSNLSCVKHLNMVGQLYASLLVKFRLRNHDQMDSESGKSLRRDIHLSIVRIRRPFYEKIQR